MTLREIDVLVAEKVFGCEVNRGPDFDYCGCGRRGLYGAHAIGMTHERCGYDDCRVVGEAIVPYSTSIAAAWAVVSALEGKTIIASEDGRERENGGFQLLGPYIKSEWRAGWLERDHEYCLVESRAATAPLAICLAALKAVGIEVKVTP